MFLVGIHLEDSVLNGLIFSKQIFSKTAGFHCLQFQVASRVTTRRIILFQTIQVATTGENNNDFALVQHP